MGRFILKLTAFLFFSFIIYTLTLILFGEYLPSEWNNNLNYKTASGGHALTRFREVKTVKSADVLIVGSSHAYRGFDPRIFSEYGYNSFFNLGSSSQTHLQTEVLLERYLKKLNPKLIIYEVYPGTFKADGIESSLDIIANDKNDFESFKLIFKHKHIKIVNSFIYGLYRDISGLNKGIKESKRKKGDEYIDGGYVQKKNKTFRNVSNSKKWWKVRDQQLDAFDGIIKSLKDMNIKFVLVQAPITSSFYQAHQNNDYFDSLMDSRGTYFNFNKLVELNDSIHFYDRHHLNQAGVNIFNKKLIQILKEKDMI
ncbi:hypothetical protein JR347_04865 [Fulvivirga lutea]|uniref:DUF1574 domain-containing protein n=2 Tax=Fulvivirga lutea TaxID=2810512 RepID=A0A975A2D2_9BACT|nr:hypothetical protein JR347_04865 [Fulvivirga lutea]